MGDAAGLKAWQVLANCERALAIELLAGEQAVEFHAPLEPGAATKAVHDALREGISFFDHDREFGPDIAQAVALVRSGALVTAAEAVTGPLD